MTSIDNPKQLPAAERMLSSETLTFGCTFRRYFENDDSLVSATTRLIDASTNTDYTGASGTGLIGAPVLSGPAVYQTVANLPKGLYFLQWHGFITTIKQPTEELTLEVPR